MTLGLISTFQLVFYTDVLHIDGTKAALLLLIARIWDAVNDPMWGAFIDSRRPTKHGRFRPYILGASFPLALSAFFMFFKLPGLSLGQYLAYAYITYILYGMFYTGANIPYGSLASVITDDEIERSSLSVFRSIGSGLGGLPAQILLPLLVYSTDNATGASVLDPQKFSLGVGILAALSVIIYFVHFKLTKERVTVPASQAKYSILKTFKALAGNKEFVVISVISLLLVVYQQFTQTNYNYLFKDFYGTPKMYSLVTVSTYLPMAIFIPFMGKLIRKFGKKELCAAGIGFSAIVNVLTYLVRFTPLISNPYVFLALTFFSGAGLTFLVLEVWALVMDVIDYHELRTGRHEESSCYSVFNFCRKLGQTFAGSGAALMLSVIGYSTEKVGNQSQDVLTKLYDITTLLPAVVLALMFVLLAFFYKFNKKNLAEMHEKLAEARKEQQ